MICSKCRTEMPDNALFCPNCGSSYSQMDDITILEENLLRNMLEEEVASKEQPLVSEGIAEIFAEGNQAYIRDYNAYDERGYNDVRGTRQYREAVNPAPANRTKPHKASPAKAHPPKGSVTTKQKIDDAREARARRLKQIERKRKKRRRIIAAIIILIILGVGGYFGVDQFMLKNPAFMLTQAQNYYEKKNYTKSLECIDKVLAQQPTNIDALEIQGQIYAQMHDEDGAIKILENVVEDDPSRVESYKTLLKLYNKKKDYQAIAALRDSCKDPTVQAVIKDYLTPVPTISVDSGKYSELIRVQLTAPNNDLSIYYTLDGSEPSVSSELYTSPVEISEEGKYELKAVCIDKNGVISDVASATYDLEYEKPEMPTLTPDGGRYYVPVVVKISIPDNCTVYYTWDGTSPTEESPVYKNGTRVPRGNNILTVVAIDNKTHRRSEELRANYIYK